LEAPADPVFASPGPKVGSATEIALSNPQPINVPSPKPTMPPLREEINGVNARLSLLHEQVNNVEKRKEVLTLEARQLEGELKNRAQKLREAEEAENVIQKRLQELEKSKEILIAETHRLDSEVTSRKQRLREDELAETGMRKKLEELKQKLTLSEATLLQAASEGERAKSSIILAKAIDSVLSDQSKVSDENLARTISYLSEAQEKRKTGVNQLRPFEYAREELLRAIQTIANVVPMSDLQRVESKLMDTEVERDEALEAQRKLNDTIETLKRSAIPESSSLVGLNVLKSLDLIISKKRSNGKAEASLVDCPQCKQRVDSQDCIVIGRSSIVFSCPSCRAKIHFSLLGLVENMILANSKTEGDKADQTPLLQ
jgi:DNA repair exonuclease SbcCD ATPase subunit